MQGEELILQNFASSYFLSFKRRQDVDLGKTKIQFVYAFSVIFWDIVFLMLLFIKCWERLTQILLL